MDTHAKQAFVDTNITGTLTLLEEAAAASVESFVFTSSTSALVLQRQAAMSLGVAA
jgi:nucleoside-diphosphate-sugar epimerase